MLRRIPTRGQADMPNLRIGLPSPHCRQCDLLIMDDTAPEVPQLREQAFVKLRQLLVDGGLRPGQFVSMPDLVRQLGLPIAPVREAVKRAEALSLVTVVPKRGAFVMDATP